MNFFFRRFRKFSFSFFVFIFIGMQIFAAAAPTRVSAIPVEDIANFEANIEQVLLGQEQVGLLFDANYARTVEYGEQRAKQAADEVKVDVATSLLSATLGAALNSVNYFIRKVAYDTAVFLGTGAAGGNAVFFEGSPGEYLAQAGGDSLANFVDQLGKQTIGLGLCEIPDIQLQLALQIGIPKIYGAGGPRPSCSWQEFKDGWSQERIREKYGSYTRDITSKLFRANVSVKQSDLGIALDGLVKADQFVAGAEETARLTRLINDGVKDVTSKISQKIVTPFTVAKRDLESLSGDSQLEKALLPVVGTYASGLLDVIPMAGSVFLNNFISTLVKNNLSTGLFPDNGSFDPNVFGDFRQGKERIESALNYIRTVNVVALETYPLIAKFTSCPENPALDNCVMDAEFAQAVNRANIDTPLTIREAIEQGLLHGDWPLIPPSREEFNSDPHCFERAYCYSNIQKMRKARILPLGFEIAALKADPDQPTNWTLKRVVDNFNACSPTGNPSSQFPYCHLINPNWVIRSFEVSCPSQVFSPALVSLQTNSRSKVCADVSTCVAYDENGNCLSQGYCTKEKNIWDIGGEKCESQYATCRTYASEEGAITSYLSRTIDYGSCRAENVGCRAYSAERLGTAPDAEWRASTQIDQTLKNQTIGRNQTFFFTNEANVQTCSESANGCSAFFTAVRNPQNGQFSRVGGNNQFVQSQNLTYLKKAPEYLGCYDTNPTTPGNQWPRTIAEVQNDVSGAAACAQFARVCVASEVGCDSFQSVNDRASPRIPGIIDALNVCARECVGYNAFKKVATEFESEQFPLYFIPQNGTQCQRQQNGCSEFTNIDALTRGGESLAYFTSLKRCDAPNLPTQQTYYSWEGSDQTGYVLRVHTLRSLDATEVAYIQDTVGTSLTDRQGNQSGTVSVFSVGSPAYASDNADDIRSYFGDCNESAYTIALDNPRDPFAAESGCRALYNTDGTVFYRLIDRTVAISNSCVPFRKTEGNFYTDTVLRTEAACSLRGGSWQFDDTVGATVCRRCTAGGRFENGACVYRAIAQESSSCPAAANGCRWYVGNTGRDVNNSIIDDDFEMTSTTLSAIGWSGQDLRFASEAIYVSQHSLRVAPGTTEATRSIPTSTLENGGTYELVFWARGALQNLSIAFAQNGNTTGPGNRPVGQFTTDPFTLQARPLILNPDWTEYRVGPVTLNVVDNGPVTLVFTRGGAQGVNEPYYLDYVRLVKLQDQTFLLRDSWKEANGADVPNSCDSTPLDAFPGEALGCQAYTNSRNQAVYTTGFGQLCREEAVGCEPLYDTQNTVGTDAISTGAQAYNVWCPRPVGTPTPNQYVCQVTVGGTTERCTVQTGEAGCYITNRFAIPTGLQLPAVNIRTSTILIPADTPTDAPIFLTNREEFACRNTEVGCQEVALEEQRLPRSEAVAFSFSEPQYVLNNPDRYFANQGSQPLLCQTEQVGCEKFAAGSEEVYFRNPESTGQAICSYAEGVVINGSAVSGWFFNTGIGRCTGAAPGTLGALCRENTDCALGTTCNTSSRVACYGDFVRRTPAGIVYDVRSNDEPTYAGYAASCPDTRDQCTEFVDPDDRTPVFPNGQPYYVKKNTITDQASTCNGTVSQNEGCVLFDETYNPRKTYNTTVTYRESELGNPPFGPVPPRSVQPPQVNNANIILKVNRDRTCSEWLYCKSYQVQEQNGVLKPLCYDYRACEAVGPNGTCSKPVEDGSIESSQPLTENLYIRRGLRWADIEYSGYSLVNKVQIANQSSVQFDLSDYLRASTDANERMRIQSLQDSSYLVYRLRSADRNCRSSTGVQPLWSRCGTSGEGRCNGESCIAPITGGFSPLAPVYAQATGPLTLESVMALLGELEGSSCKAYPAEDSPFPQTVLADPLTGGTPFTSLFPLVPNSLDATRVKFQERKAGFAKVNICQTPTDCSCVYKKVTYQNGQVDYWPQNQNTQTGGNIPARICSGGIYDGRSCTNTEDCNPVIANDSSADTLQQKGRCVGQKQVEKFFGLTGFCLERDYSRRINGGGENPEYACLTWLPIQVSASAIDIFNINPEAGYYPPRDATVDGVTSGKLYCAASTRVSEGFTVPPVDPNRSTLALNTLSDGINRFNAINPSGGSLITSRLCESDTTAVPPVGITAFQDLVCDSDSGEVFPLLQAWTWFLIGRDTFSTAEPFTNSLLLRLEQPSEDDTGVVVRSERPPGGPNSGRYFVFHTFAPHQNDLENEAGQEVIDERGVGTLFHPPRQFDLGVPPGATATFGPSTWGYRYRDPQSGQLISTDPLGVASVQSAPGYTFTPYTNNPNGGGFRHYSERLETLYLNRKDLTRVYFVPVTYPGGGEGVLLPSLSKQFYIDIAALDRGFRGTNSPANDQVEKIDAWFNDTNTNGYGWNFYLQNHQQGREADAYRLSYKMEHLPTCTGQNCLGSYSDYALTQGEGGGQGSTELSGWLWDDYQNGRTDVTNGIRNTPRAERYLRNQIQTRYVSVFFVTGDGDDDHPIAPPRFIDNSTSGQPRRAGSLCTSGSCAFGDPFEPEACQRNATTENWFAIGMDFNTDGEFLGYISRWCSATPANSNFDANGINFAVIANLVDQCTNFVEVYRDTGTGLSTNKAWTNRTWLYGRNATVAGAQRMNHPVSILAQIQRERPLTPFGSLYGGEYALADIVQSQSSVLRQYTFRNPTSASVGSVQGLLSSDLSRAQDILASGIPYSCDAAVPWLGATYLSGGSGGQSRCTALARAGYTGLPLTALGSLTRQSGHAAIRQLFAAFYDVRQIQNAVGQVGASSRPQAIVTPAADLDGNSDRSGEAALTGTGPTALVPPQVFGVTGDCNIQGASGRLRPCVAAERNTISINGRNHYIGASLSDYNGDGVPEEDANNSTVPDPIIGLGVQSAHLQFFAMADDNRMPLSRVVVDWGDSYPPEFRIQTGLYRNRKPYCATNALPATVKTVGVCTVAASSLLTPLTCNVDRDCLAYPGATCTKNYEFERFGNSLDACVARPFAFDHEYTCSRADTDPLSATHPPYVMTVSAASNLNADAGDRLRELNLQPGDLICVYRPRVQVTDNWGWCNNGVNPDTGSYNTQCDQNQNAWTQYRGWIFVVPLVRN